MIQGWLYVTDRGRHVRGLQEITSDESIADVELLTDDYEVLWPSSQAVNDDGELVYESDGAPRLFGWGIRELLLDRVAQGSMSFDREKQNEISAEEGAIFQTDWLRFFADEQIFFNDNDGHYYLLPEVKAA
jgi:hypothetical protein